MFCEKCGTKLEEGMIFCPECGFKCDYAREMNQDQETEISVEVREDQETEIPVDVREVLEETADEMAEETNVQGPIQEENTEEEAAVVENPIVPSPTHAMEISETRYCHNCGAANTVKDMFCYACGTPLTEGTKKSYFRLKPDLKLPPNLLKKVIPVAGAIIVLLVFVFLNHSGNKANIVYLKDNEIVSLNNKEPYVIGSDTLEEDDISNLSYSFSSNIKISEDGKFIYYPQNYKDEEFDLYTKKLGNEKNEETKVDSEVTDYQLLDNGKIVYRTDFDTQKLYVYNKGKKEKVASEVIDYFISENEKLLLYRNFDNELYKCNLSKGMESENLDFDTTMIVYHSPSLDRIVYLKEDVLYCLNDFENREKIDSDVSIAFSKTEDSQDRVYYLKSEGNLELGWANFVEDDLAEVDAAIAEPDIADYQHIEVRDSFWGPMEEVITDDSYYDAYATFEEKLQRDAIREDLTYNSESLEQYSLYCYMPDMKEGERLIDENVIGYKTPYSAPGFLVEIYQEDAIDKILMSDLTYRYWQGEDMSDIIKAASGSVVGFTAVYNGSLTEISIEYQEYLQENYYLDYLECLGIEEKSRIFYFAMYNEETGKRILFSKDLKAAESEVNVMSEEYVGMACLDSSGLYYYTGEYDSADLYCGEEMIDSDVRAYSLRKLVDDKGFIYITDPDDKDMGTLKLYRSGSNPIKIDDDVYLYAYDTNKDGDIAYVIDYNTGKYRGDLMEYKGGKSQLIDVNVTSILYY